MFYYYVCKNKFELNNFSYKKLIFKVSTKSLNFDCYTCCTCITNLTS